MGVAWSDCACAREKVEIETVPMTPALTSVSKLLEEHQELPEAVVAEFARLEGLGSVEVPLAMPA